MKYRRIADDLRSGIRRGDYEPGHALPGENDLMARYKVARMTVRQALAELQREGLAVARRGSGVYVLDARPIVREGTTVQPPLPPGASVWADGDGEHELDVDEVETGWEAAPEHVAEALEIDPGSSVQVNSCRVVVDRREVMLRATWRPITVSDGLTPTRFREEVRARPAAAHEADRLVLSPGAPVLAVQRIGYRDDRPVEVTEMVLDASVYVLRYEFPAP
ncbi:MAG TPA: GntR family transcriptional regulator [Sporichthyaceae bacterium]